MIPSVSENTNEMVESVCSTLHECASQSKNRAIPRNNIDINVHRWHRLLNNNDDANIWKAID